MCFGPLCLCVGLSPKLSQSIRSWVGSGEEEKTETL